MLGPESGPSGTGGAFRGLVPGLPWGGFGSLFCPMNGPCIMLVHWLSRCFLRISRGRASFMVLPRGCCWDMSRVIGPGRHLPMWDRQRSAPGPLYREKKRRSCQAPPLPLFDIRDTGVGVPDAGRMGCTKKKGKGAGFYPSYPVVPYFTTSVSIHIPYVGDDICNNLFYPRSSCEERMELQAAAPLPFSCDRCRHIVLCTETAPCSSFF